MSAHRDCGLSLHQIADNIKRSNDAIYNYIKLKQNNNLKNIKQIVQK